jgi:hypothetical protein
MLYWIQFIHIRAFENMEVNERTDPLAYSDRSGAPAHAANALFQTT